MATVYHLTRNVDLSFPDLSYEELAALPQPEQRAYMERVLAVTNRVRALLRIEALPLDDQLRELSERILRASAAIYRLQTGRHLTLSQYRRHIESQGKRHRRAQS
jgi:hypothetical protein